MESSMGGFGKGKRKRGRRRLYGRRSGRLFWRDELIVEIYNELRSKSADHSWEIQKHSWVVAETVRVIKQRHPGIRMSKTEVKRVLAMYQSRFSNYAMKVTSKPQQQVNEEFEKLPQEIKDFLGNKPPVNVKPFGFGPRPICGH